MVVVAAGKMMVIVPVHGLFYCRRPRQRRRRRHLLGGHHLCAAEAENGDDSFVHHAERGRADLGNDVWSIRPSVRPPLTLPTADSLSSDVDGESSDSRRGGGDPGITRPPEETAKTAAEKEE